MSANTADSLESPLGISPGSVQMFHHSILSQISPYPTSLALVMEEFLEMDLGEGAFPSYSESDRYRKDSRRPCECSPLTWLCRTSGARASALEAPPAPPAIGDEEVPPPASTSKLK